MFSFNSAVGACETCRGFGRVIGVDYGLVIPNDKLTLRAGAIKTIQTPAWKEAQDDLMRHAEAAGIPRDTPWNKLTPEQQALGDRGHARLKEGKWNKQWYGVQPLLRLPGEQGLQDAHPRAACPSTAATRRARSARGARLKLESLLWRIGSKEDADAVLDPAKRFMPVGVKWSRAQLEALPGLCLHDLMLLPIERLRRFFDRHRQPTATRQHRRATGDVQALKLLFEEITTRLRYLHDVGIGYLTLDRQSRTLSRRRGAAHQPHHRARHLAGQHAVRARRAQHRPASARHEPHHRGHAAPARRRQHAGGGRARPGRDAGGRPHDRHGPGPRRARRPDRVRRHAPTTCATPTR